MCSCTHNMVVHEYIVGIFALIGYTRVCVGMRETRWSLLEEERKINRLLRDDPENDKLNDRLQQVR